MWFPFLVFVFWVTFFFSVRYAWLRWRQWRYLQPARYISEIHGVEYYRNLSAEQFEWLLTQTFKLGKFTMLGDPYLGRSRQQGYAWKAGKKFAVLACLEKPLAAEDLEEIGTRQKRVHVDHLLVFSPFPGAPHSDQPGLEVIAGRKLVSWFAVLENLRPPLPHKIDVGACECGSPMEQRINRAGQDLLVCSRYPDCSLMQRPGAGK